MKTLIQWLMNHLLFAGTMFFAAAAPPVPAAPAAPAAGAAPTPTPTPTPDPGAQPGQPADVGLRQLRDQYEQTKQQLEPWQKLNLKPDQVGQFQGVYQKLHGEVATMGRELGYPDEEIAEALAEDPVRTLDFLRNEAARLQKGGQERGDGQDLQELVAQHVEQAIGPIQERENHRMTDAANSLFERTVHQMAVDSFKAEGIDVANIPQDEMGLLMNATSEILKYDDKALHALKFEGKTAAIQQAFQEARTYLDKYYLARSGRDRARVAPPARPGAPAPTGAKRPTLDEMIDNPSVIDEAAGRDAKTGRYR